MPQPKIAGPLTLRDWYLHCIQQRGGGNAARERVQRSIMSATRFSWRTVGAWMRGQRRPSLKAAITLEKISSGAVQAVDFYPELAELEKLHRG